MKKSIFIWFLSITTIIAVSCSKNDTLEPTETVTAIQDNPSFKYNTTVNIDSEIIKNYINNMNTKSSKNDKNSAPVFDETFTYQSSGSSTIKTNNSGVTFTYKASNIPYFDPSGHAVTLWAVFFDPGVEIKEENIASMYRVSGHVIGYNGKVNFGGRVNKGQEKDLWYGVPLKDTQNFVLLVIAKTHGEAIPAILKEQLSELEGGCNGDGPDPDPPCYEFLWSVHI